jgi:hypothetical protein
VFARCGCVAHSIRASLPAHVGCTINDSDESFLSHAWMLPHCARRWTSENTGRIRLTYGAYQKCLDFNGNAYNGAWVYIYDCNNEWTQRWVYRLPTWHAQGIVGLVAHRCRSLARQARANIAAPARKRRWFMDPMGRLRNYAAPHKCLDVKGGNADVGTQVQLWDCDNVKQQFWYASRSGA